MKTKPEKLFKYEIPELDTFIGRKVKIKGEKKPITIKTIVGNVGMTLGRKPKDQRPQWLEINGKHLISMLRFFNEMNGGTKETGITEEMLAGFEEIEFWSEKMTDEVILDPEALKKGEVKIVKGKKC